MIGATRFLLWLHLMWLMSISLFFPGEKQREKEKDRERMGSVSSVSSKTSASSGYSSATMHSTFKNMLRTY